MTRATKNPKPKSRKTATTRRRTPSKMTAQVKDSAMKVLAGAASGAVEALIPQLEQAAGRSARSAGTGKTTGRRGKSRQ